VHAALLVSCGLPSPFLAVVFSLGPRLAVLGGPKFGPTARGAKAFENEKRHSSDAGARPSIAGRGQANLIRRFLILSRADLDHEMSILITAVMLPAGSWLGRRDAIGITN